LSALRDSGACWDGQAGGPGSAAAMRLVVDLSLGRIKPATLPPAQPVNRRNYAAPTMPLYEEDDIDDDMEFEDEDAEGEDEGDGIDKR